MHKYIKAVLSVAVAASAMVMLCLPAFAQAETAEHKIWFSAYCQTAADITAAQQAGANGIALSKELDFADVLELVQEDMYIIIDAADLEEAEKKYHEILAHGEDTFEQAVFRIKGSASKVIKWAESKEIKPMLIGFYTGNIYFSALSCINRFTKYERINAVQLQTGNQDGVILHNSVTFMFNKTETAGMFSFINTAKSAKRTDTARSWDDLIARGYDVIETAYPQDFAEYLKENAAEYKKLQASVENALNADIETAFENRIGDYEHALESAQALLADGSCAIYEMADARAVLDEAVDNLSIDDGKKVKGDFEITPGRVAACLFGVALVLSWQIYFRKKWGKKA